MTQAPLAVVIRVHDRMQDLQVAVRCVKEHWRIATQLMIVSNGVSRGFEIPADVRAAADSILELTHNAGHIGGNAQLLLASIPHLPPQCEWVLLLEADTWLFDDRLLRDTLNHLEQENADWASAFWQDRWSSQALDLALVRRSVLQAHPGLVDFHQHAECHVANYLQDHGLKALRIRELEPVHIPGLLRRCWNQWGGRFRCFPEGPMVTHHIEDLPGGFRQKLAEANRCAGRELFPGLPSEEWAKGRRRITLMRTLARLCPRSGWIKPPRRRS